MKSLFRQLVRWLAGRVLARHQPAVVVVAGSVGKTAAKEAIAAGITNGRTVRKTEGNFNAEVGVPVTVISGGGPRTSIFGWLNVVLDGFRGGRPAVGYPSTLVLELGADHPGDLDPLLKLVQPSIGVLTSVAPEHLEFFGDERGVINEETLVIRRLAATATGVVNLDDKEIAAFLPQVSCRLVTFGWHERSDIRAETISLTKNDRGLPDGQVVKVFVSGSTIPVALPGVLGRHQVYPILAAIAVGTVLGDDPVTISQRLSAYRPPAGRMRLFEGLDDSLLIDDSYNASPAAVMAAIETLAEVEIPGRKNIILGQMSELGAAAAGWHDKVGQAVAAKKFYRLVTVGPLARRIGDAAVSAGMPAGNVMNVDTAEAAASAVQGDLHSGDAVLLKGSRFAARLERAVKLLLAYPERDGGYLVGGSSDGVH